jgi:hypothetical protein
METPTNTTEKIIAAIDQQKVTPRPKWYFRVRNTLMWIPGVITTLLGAYTIAGGLYGILHAHWENREYVQYRGPLVFIAIIPLLWIISFALFSLITIALLRKTNTGYRHTALQLLLISVASSIIIGMLFYAMTANSLNDGVETYYRHPTQNQQEYVWNSPTEGRISGVVSATSPTTLTIRAFNGFVWTVDISKLSSAPDPVLLQVGNAVRIVGAITASHSFLACRVLPWELFPAQPSVAESFTGSQQAISCDEILQQYISK